MEWSGEGIIIGTRKHGETSLIVELMTPKQGRHLGLVRGGRSRKMQPLLQPGNKVEVTWRARLSEHLGTFTVEPMTQNAAWLMESRCGILGIQLLGSHLRLLPERDPHRGLYDALEVMIEHLANPDIVGPLMVSFELRLLEELGFGLNLTQCAGGGSNDNLIYVSPKSGQAVSASAGEPWADKLLALPQFLLADSSRYCTAQDLRAAFDLTGYFLQRDVWLPRGVQTQSLRDDFSSAVLRGFSNG